MDLYCYILTTCPEYSEYHRRGHRRNGGKDMMNFLGFLPSAQSYEKISGLMHSTTLIRLIQLEMAVWGSLTLCRCQAT